jgi:hypothetical protein
MFSYDNNYELFKDDLMDGEELLWAGQPNPGKIFGPEDLFLIPFSLMWGGFAIFWEIMALSIFFSHKTGKTPPPVAIIFPLFGIPFVLIGLYLIFGRFFYKAWKKKRTFYAVSDKQILILTNFKAKNIQALFIKNLPVINKTSSAQGIGTLSFGNMPGFPSGMGNSGWMGASSTLPAFYDIDEVDKVYNTINEARNRTSDAQDNFKD